MFRIRAVTPAVQRDDGRRLAGGLLVVGDARLPFVLDLTYWSVADYERQWQAGTRRLVEGAPSSALLTAYRGPGEAEHLLWALWRDDEHVYVQERSVLATAAASFDPRRPYAPVGARMPSSGYAPPVQQWRVELVPFLAAALGIRLPRALG